MNTMISFPHLGICLEHVGKSVPVFGFEIAYYGIIMGCSILLGLYLAEREAKRTGQNPDTYTDMVIYAIIFSIICARTYYVVFSWDNYKDNLLSIFNLRQGGIAIYGAIIGAVTTVYVYSRVKKISFTLMLDTACIGLVAGQILGRWGNFFNREAFGGYTDGLLAMQLPVSAVIIIPHPAQNFNTLQCDILIENTVYFSFSAFRGALAEMGGDGVDSAANLPLKTDGVAILMLFQPV